MALVYDMKYLRESVSIREVADLLGLHRKGNMVRCWRPGHAHGDRTPSMGLDIRRNRARCFVCDAKQLSTLDLVAAHESLTLQEAAEWISGRFSVPTLGRKARSKGNETVAGYWRRKDYEKLPEWFRPYVESLVLHPYWSALPPFPAKIATIITVLLLNEILAHDKYQVEICNKDLRELSGRSKRSVLRAVSTLKNRKFITVTRTKGECCIYEVNTIPRGVVEGIIEEKHSKRSKA